MKPTCFVRQGGVLSWLPAVRVNQSLPAGPARPVFAHSTTSCSLSELLLPPPAAAQPLTGLTAEMLTQQVLAAGPQPWRFGMQARVLPWASQRSAAPLQAGFPAPMACRAGSNPWPQLQWALRMLRRLTQRPSCAVQPMRPAAAAPGLIQSPGTPGASSLAVPQREAGCLLKRRGWARCGTGRHTRLDHPSSPSTPPPSTQPLLAHTLSCWAACPAQVLRRRWWCGGWL